MKRISVLLILCLAWVAAPAAAEVMHYSKCKLNDGKTIDDAQAWAKAWRVLKAEKGIDYKVRLLIPHADNDLESGEFFLEGSSSTLQTYAAAWDWWYTDTAASKSAEQLNAAATCNSGAVYRSND